jgi:osomolarity two-component system response regulator SKN7
MNTQLTATQQQLQHLQERYDDLANGHVILLQQVVQLQKIVKNHDGAMQKVMGFLHSVDAQRRNSRATGVGNGIGIADLIGSGSDDHPASPLQQASRLLGEYSAEQLFNKDLEQMQAGFTYRSEFSTPSNEHTSTTGTLGHTPGAGMITGGNPTPSTSMYHHNYDLDTMVYPVGQNQGIDPISSEHIVNIPYSLPPNIPPDVQAEQLAAQSKSFADRKKSFNDPGWGARKPRVLLVEDDRTCARVGAKFLQSFQCMVEIARDGLQAVKVMTDSPNSFDLIFMDIIMPNLDGISATVCIREINMAIPIIAMTSNIRSDDIEMYFKYGMFGCAVSSGNFY